MAESADSEDTITILGTELPRRDFLVYGSSAMGALGAALALWPFVDSMNPAADTMAMATTEVDLSGIEVGQSVTVTWQGKPVFIRHRTESDIEKARTVDIATLRDPAADEDRVQKPEWLIMVGICTHLGCIPLGQKKSDPHGDYDGWFCPCHGSHYDTAGRIRKGPAPLNLAVPPYEFLDETMVKIG